MNSGLTAAIISLTVGLVVGYVTGRAQSPVPELGNKKVLLGVEKLQDLTNTDIAEYYRLKDLEDRYLKADEILAKIMTVFLADLSIRMKTGTHVAMSESSPGTAALDASTKKAPLAEPGNELRPPVKSPRTGHSENEKAAPAGMNEPTTVKASIGDLRHEHEIEDFLRESQIENFGQVIKKSAGFSNKAGVLTQINGRFAGSANVVRGGESAIWDIEFVLNGRLINEKFEGERTLKLSEDGTVFSDSSGSGNLGNEFREIPVDPEAVVTTAGPDTFFQFYYVRSMDSLVGNILRKEDITEGYKTIGSFKLSRQ